MSRPQGRSPVSGRGNVGEVGLMVTSQPVDTSVIQGTQGAPALPTPLQKPELEPTNFQPDLQKARDMEALSKSFGMLSTSIGNLGMAQERKGQMLEEWGAEMGALGAYLRSEGKTWADALDSIPGGIEMLDHPRAQQGLAKGEADFILRNVISPAYDEASTLIRAGKNRYDLNPYSERWDKIVQDEMKSYSGPRPDVFAAELLRKQGGLKLKSMSAERKWIGGELLNNSINGLENQVNDLLDHVRGVDGDISIVSTLIDPNTSNPIDRLLYRGGIRSKTTEIKGVSKEEAQKKALNEVKSKLAALMDEEIGGVLSPKIVHEVIGKRLVDVAATNSELSQIAIEMLDTPTGPKDSRTKLRDIASVKGYLQDHEDQIKSRQVVGDKNQRRAMFNNTVDGIEMSWRNTLSNFVGATSHTQTPKGLIGELVGHIFEGENRVVIDGLTYERNATGIRVYSPEGEFERSINLNEMAANVQTDVLEREIQIVHEGNPDLTRYQALVAASLRTGVNSDEIARAAGHVTNRITVGALANPDTPPEEAERIVRSCEELYSAYVSIRRHGSDIDRFFGEGAGGRDAGRIFGLVDVMVRNGHSPSVGHAIRSLSIAATNLDTEIQWGERENIPLVDPLNPLNPGGSPEMRGEIARETKLLAEVLLRTGEINDVEDAVNTASTVVLENYNELGETLVHRSDWNSELLSSSPNIPHVLVGGNWGWLDPLAMDPSPAQIESEMVIQTLMRSPELLGNFIERASQHFSWDNMNPATGNVPGVQNELARKEAELREEELLVYDEIMRRTLQNVKDKSRLVHWPELVEGAEEGLLTNPPDEFLLDNERFGDSQFVEYRLVPVQGTKMRAWTVRGITETGESRLITNENNMYTIKDIADWYHRSGALDIEKEESLKRGLAEMLGDMERTEDPDAYFKKLMEADQAELTPEQREMIERARGQQETPAPDPEDEDPFTYDPTRWETP